MGFAPQGGSLVTPGFPHKQTPETQPEHVLAEVFRGFGHQVWSRCGTLWIDAGRFSLVTIPCNEPVTACKAEIQQLLQDSGRLIAVFATPTQTGVPSSHFWVRDRAYSLASLQRQFRQHIKHYGHLCHVRTVPWEEIQQSGLKVNQDTMNRRGLNMSLCTTAEGWSKICANAALVPGLEATGCFLDDQLTGFLVSWTHNGVCNGLILHRDSQYQSLGAANILAYQFTHEMINRPDVQSVTMGRGWFPPEETIDRFKRHAGYVEEPLQLAVVLHPRWEKVLGSSFILRILKSLDGLSGRRFNISSDVQVLEAAAVTRLS